MRNWIYTTCLALAPLGMLSAQNVGIGIAAPAQKLHVSDATLPNGATVRVSGLSSTTTLAAGTGPMAVVIVDANGVMSRGGTMGAGGTDAWYTLGNAGTVPTTHFLGTTDAQDFVMKTAGSTAAFERMRVIGAGATPGQIVVNNTGILAGDVFSVYANGTNNGSTNSINNSIGNFAVNGYASGNGIGVYGEVYSGASSVGTAVWGALFATNTTASSASEGVWGSNTSAPLGTGGTAAVAAGVRGEATGAAGTANTIGVLGITTSTTGSAYGIYGQSSSPTGLGVFGVNLDVSVNPSHGIQGQSAAVGGGAGVRGFHTATNIAGAQSGFGVRGSANGVPVVSGFACGVRGDATSTSGSTYGVYGLSASSTGFGMDAVNTHALGTGIIIVGNNSGGTYLGSGTGAAINGNPIGTFSIAKTAASGIGVVAVGNNLTGSIFVPASGCGVSAIGAQFGVMGYGTTTVNTAPGSTSAANGANASAGGYFEVLTGATPQTWAYVGVRDNTGVNRKIIGNGTVNTIVNDLQGNRVALSCPEAPENLFQDYGQGRLVNGRAHIDLDPILARNIVVNAQHPLRVFVQLEGDCQGVFVSNKTGSGFDVAELNGGTSNVAFSYTVVGNRADEVNPDGTVAHYSDERFPSAPGPQTTTPVETLTDPEAARYVPSDEPVVPPANITKTTSSKLDRMSQK